MLTLTYPVRSFPYSHPCRFSRGIHLAYNWAHSASSCEFREISISQLRWSHFLVCSGQSWLLPNVLVSLWIISPFVFSVFSVWKICGFINHSWTISLSKGSQKDQEPSNLSNQVILELNLKSHIILELCRICSHWNKFLRLRVSRGWSQHIQGVSSPLCCQSDLRSGARPPHQVQTSHSFPLREAKCWG